VTVAAVALLIGLAASTERCRGWQVAVDTVTACAPLTTTARFASTDATACNTTHTQTLNLVSCSNDDNDKCILCSD